MLRRSVLKGLSMAEVVRASHRAHTELSAKRSVVGPPFLCLAYVLRMRDACAVCGSVGVNALIFNAHLVAVVSIRCSLCRGKEHPYSPTKKWLHTEASFRFGLQIYQTLMEPSALQMPCTFWAHAQDQHLDLGGCGSLSALITLEQKFGARAFQLLGYTKACDGFSDGVPAGMRRLAGGWCRSSEKSAGHSSASMVRVKSLP